jgi:hypothetical protein
MAMMQLEARVTKRVAANSMRKIVHDREGCDPSFKRRA